MEKLHFWGSQNFITLSHGVLLYCVMFDLGNNVLL